jgi:hypothetical protein
MRFIVTLFQPFRMRATVSEMKSRPMNPIQKQALRVRRRLITNRFFQNLPATLLVTLMIALLGVMTPKLIHLPVSDSVWFGSWMVGGLLVGLLSNGIMTFLGRPTVYDAAAELDRRFGLRERLSSSLMLTAEDRDTELGRALVADAQRRAESIDIRDKFDWGLHRRLWIPLLPLMLAGLFFVVPNREAPATAINQDAQSSLNQVKNSTKPLLEQVQRKRKLAEEQGLAAAVDMFKRLEGELSELQKETKLDTKQTLAKLNDIKQQLDERRKELGGSDALKKNLKNLEKLEAGPADKLAQSLKEGDFNKAEEALEKLMRQLEEGKLDAEGQKALEKQLEQMEKALAGAAAAHEQAKQALREQIRQAEAAGDMQKAAQLQRKLEQAEAQDATMAQMQQLSESLQECQNAMKSGNTQAAREALEKMASQLQQMNASDAQLQDLEQLMDSLSQSKSQMMCKQCSGDGCTSCMGSMPGQIPGSGLGEGQAQGERPEAEDNVDFFDSQVRDQMKLGETLPAGKVGGENRKGTSQVEVQEAVLSSLSEEPEPLDDTPLPKAQRDHARDYFNSIREGK